MVSNYQASIFTPHTVNLALMVPAAVDHYFFCDDPASLQSLVSWVQEAIWTGEVKKMYPSSRQHTSRSAFLCMLTPSGQGALNHPCRGLPQTSVLSLEIKTGLLLPPLMYLSVFVHAYSLPYRSLSHSTATLV